MQTYEHYKDSGIDWIGPIPEHWEVKPGFSVLKERKEKNKGMISSNVLSLSYGKIIEKPIEKLTGLVPENFETYQLVYKGDIIFRPTDLQNDKVSLRTGLSKFNGIITSAYINLQPINSEPKFLHYYLHTTDTNKVIYGLGSGLRQNISFLDFKRFGFVVPPIQEQKAIANFLDEKTAKIDALVQTKEQQIEKLKELRQAKIHQAVTKGLDANAPTKYSGIEWIGEIPAHWEVRRFANSFSLGKGLTITKEYLRDEGVFCLNYGEIHSKYGFEVNPEIHQLRCVDEDYLKTSSSSLLEKGDFVFADTSEDLKGSGNFTYLSSNIKTFAGYHTVIARPNKDLNSRFLAYEFDSAKFRSQIQSKVKGVKVFSITQTLLKTLFIWLPQIQEQEQIVAYLDEVTGKIDQAIAQKQEQITKLKEYKQSLINDVVTGKVKVC